MPTVKASLNRRAVFFVVLMGLLVSGPLCRSEADLLTPTEYEVKAAFLYNFAKFVDWPPQVFPNDEAPIILGLLGEDVFGLEIDQMLSGKTAQNRNLILRRLKNPAEAESCHMIFISKSETDNLGKIFRALNGKPVLTVSDIDRFAERGGMIGLSMEEKRVRLNVNREVSDAAHLKISSQVLKLAKIVK